MERNYYSVLKPSQGDQASNPKQPTYRTVQYQDGTINLRLDMPGTCFGDFPTKYTDDLRWRNGYHVLVDTQSGNSYAIGDGVLLNTRENRFYDTRSWKVMDEPEIGKPWAFAGSDGDGITTVVTGIEMRYKEGAQNTTGTPVDGENPFVKISPRLLACTKQLS